MPALHDQHDLLLAESVNAFVGTPDMGQHRQLSGGIVHEHRIMRGDELAGVAAHKRGPRVLADQLAHDLGIVAGMRWVGSHPKEFCASWCAARRGAQRVVVRSAVSQARPRFTPLLHITANDCESERS
jgi:hypothetical protein